MSISKNISSDGKEITISIQGRFDFSSHQAFREAYEHKGIAQYIVDLQDTTYLDSSALGMLLLLRDHAGGDQATIQIVNCNDEVQKIFSVSNFEQLFDIQ